MNERLAGVAIGMFGAIVLALIAIALRLDAIARALYVLAGLP